MSESNQPEKKRVLKIQVLSPERKEKIESLYQNRDFYHPGDSGLDLFCVQDQVIPPGLSSKIKLGIAVSMGTFIKTEVSVRKSAYGIPGAAIEQEERSDFTPNS